MNISTVAQRSILGLVGAAAITASIASPAFAANDVTQVITANGPVRVSGQAINGTGGPGIPSGGATGPLNEPIVVLVASDGFGAGVYTQTYNVVLIIPAGSQAGTYTAVVDATTSAAP